MSSARSTPSPTPTDPGVRAVVGVLAGLTLALASLAVVARAATALHRVQSNVTTRVKQLEERLGAKLFHRQGRKLVLSSEGRLLLEYAERLLRLSTEAYLADLVDCPT